MKLRRGLFLLICIGIWGCSNVSDNSIVLDASGKHPAGWVVATSGGLHPAIYRANQSACVECHGSAQDAKASGGISGVSCFSSSRSGITCHPAGPSGHPAGWSAPGSHGSAAKMASNTSQGFTYCTQCHGSDFVSGSGTSCKKCHTSAPHPVAPWRGTAITHTTTDQGNVSQCARCHLNNQRLSAPATVPVGSTPGCFNGTLCHGPKKHSFPNPGSAHRTALPSNCNGIECHNTTSTTGVYLVSSGTAPNCAACHTLSLFVGCSDCHGSVVNNNAGALMAGRPTGGTAFPNRPGQHNRKEHVGRACTACHPFTTGDARHGWSNGLKSAAAQVGGTGTSINSWNSTTKSCTPTCHSNEVW